MKPRNFLLLCVTFHLGICYGDDLEQFRQEKSRFEALPTPVAESERESYIDRLVALGRSNDSAWKECSAEMLRHPAPADSEPEKLSNLLIGEWSTGRHEVGYSKTGKWYMLPLESQCTRGFWRFEGNRFVEIQGNDVKQFTLILLNKSYFVLSDGEHVLIKERVTSEFPFAKIIGPGGADGD